LARGPGLKKGKQKGEPPGESESQGVSKGEKGGGTKCEASSRMKKQTTKGRDSIASKRKGGRPTSKDENLKRLKEGGAQGSLQKEACPSQKTTGNKGQFHARRGRKDSEYSWGGRFQKFPGIRLKKKSF